MCDPAKEAENLGKSLDQAGRDFDHTVAALPYLLIDRELLYF